MLRLNPTPILERNFNAKILNRKNGRQDYFRVFFTSLRWMLFGFRLRRQAFAAAGRQGYRGRLNMNILPVPPAHAGATDGEMRWKKLGIGVILGFTLKGLITAFLLAITLSEFIHY